MSSFTRHAEARVQQRGLSPFVLDLIVDNGVCTRFKEADVYSLDKRGRKRLKKTLGALVYKRLEDLLGAFVMVGDDGQIITCGHRYKRIQN